jgi:tetratricopeptide (TPR) repeat protein
MRLRKIGTFMSGQIGWPLIGLTLIGLIGIFKVSRRLFLAFPLAIIGNLAVVLWAADFSPRNYDLINYLAPLTAFILVVGIAGTLYLVRARVVTGQAAIAMSLLIGVFTYLGWNSNYNQANLAGVNAPEELSQEILKDVPNGSLLIVAEDNVLLPLWYSAYAESSAARINIVSAGAMINAKYRKQLTVNYPSLIYPVDFTNELSGQADRLAESLCRLNADHRDVYIQFGVPGIKANEVEPFGIIFKYVGENGISAKFNPDSYRIQMQLADRLLLGNPDEIQTIDFVGRWLFNAAVYYDRINQPEIAWKLFNRALDVDKTNLEMRVRLASALAKGGKYKEALQYISQALEIDPNDKVSLELGHRIVQAIEKSGLVAANE